MKPATWVALPLAASAYTAVAKDRRLTHIVNAAAQEWSVATGVWHWQAQPVCRRVAASSVLQDMALAAPPEQATCERCRDAFDFVRGGPK